MELVGGSDVATAESSPRDVRDPTRMDSRRRHRNFLSGGAPLSLAVLIVPLVVGLVRVLVSLHQPYIHYGDVAVIESAIRDTLGGHQLLGPYSHFGWFHPGPAYFYLVAPLYWVLHENARALFLGAFLINAGCAVAIVAVVRTRCGESAARWGTLVVGGLLFFTEASGISLYSPWNPALLALPLLLVMVLVASSATGSTISLLWAVVIGSFVVQTELGTAPTAFAVLVVGAALWGWTAWRRRRLEPTAGRTRHRAAVAGTGLLVALVWLPPLIQQTTQSPGNVGRTVHFFEHPPTAQQAGGGHTRGQAVRAVAEYATALPLKANAFPCCEPNQFSGPRSLYTDRFVGFGAGVLVALGVTVIGWRRRDRFAMTLGAISVVAAGTAILAATQVVGPLFEHLVWWTTVVFVPGWIGAGVLGVGWLRTGTRTGGRLSAPFLQPMGSVLLAVGCAVPCLALAWSFLRDPPVGYGDDPGRAAAVQLVEQPVRAMHVHDLRVRLADPSQAALTASVVIELQKAGVAVHLEAPGSNTYGSQEQIRGADQALLVISGPHDSAPASSTAGATHLGTVQGTEFWLRPMPVH
jgi:hypothetical protein